MSAPNTSLAALDQAALAAATSCRAQPLSDWSRGMPHPTALHETPTYDLATGAHVDWRQFLPADFLAPEPKRYGDDTIKATPRLRALYLSLIPDASPECLRVLQHDVSAFQVWLDADAGGLILMPVALPHAVRVCGDAVTLPPDLLAEIGAAPALIDALKQHN